MIQLRQLIRPVCQLKLKPTITPTVPLLLSVGGRIRSLLPLQSRHYTQTTQTQSPNIQSTATSTSHTPVRSAFNNAPGSRYYVNFSHLAAAQQQQLQQQPQPILNYNPATAAQPSIIQYPAFGSGRQFSSLIQQQVSEYARQPQQGVTLRQLLAVGPKPSKAALLESAKFCYKELPIRLAKRVKELESLPYGLSQLPPVLKVRGWYEASFRELLSHPPPTTEAEELSFTHLLELIYNRHADVVPTLAQGVLQMKRELGASGTDVVNQCPFLQDFLNRFHSSRIGIRLLISQHIALHQPVEGFIGTIATNLSPMSVIRDAVSDAARICDRQYGWAPEVDIIGDESEVINFVPNHLHHIMFELMKNSMRAVIEFHGIKNYDAPAIQVVLANDEERYAIKISDQGGGIPRKDMPRIWSYLYTTTNPTSTEQLLQQIQGQSGTNGGSNANGGADGVDAAGGHPTNAVGPESGTGAPMSGFGYGLPISRLYASYFGGDLNIVSVQGYGTDAYLYLNKLGQVTTTTFINNNTPEIGVTLLNFILGEFDFSLDFVDPYHLVGLGL